MATRNGLTSGEKWWIRVLLLMDKKFPRLTLDKSVDLDVGPESQSCDQYRATLGHKACHSFEMKNAAFREFEHPRFGRIMSVVALRDIQRDEEVFVSYNYSVSHAPEWYQVSGL